MKKIILILLMLTALVQAEQGSGKFYQNESISVVSSKQISFYYNRSTLYLKDQNTNNMAINLYKAICADKDINELSHIYKIRYVYIYKDGIYQIDVPECR